MPGSGGPISTAERSLAPDLARGAMLLLIVLANTPHYLYDADRGLSSAHPTDGSVLDRLVQATIITVVDARVYPMFACLVGYGIAQLYRRQYDAGVPERVARRILRRRHWWLLAFGLVHAALLWMGDVLGAYGVAGLIVVVAFLRRRDLTLVIWITALAGLIVSGALALVGITVALARFAPAEIALTDAAIDPFALAIPGIANPDYAASMLDRVAVWAVVSVAQLLGLIIPLMMLLGFWAARRRILEEPARHRRLLVRVAVVGIAVGWLGGLPHALAHVGVFSLPEGAEVVFLSVQATTGMICGVGYVAAFGLLATRVSSQAPAVRALSAVGQRSLSAYLAQSVLCAPVLSAWGLGVGARIGSATLAAYAVGCWLITVAGAVLLQRANRRGPAEVALRRLAYGRR